MVAVRGGGAADGAQVKHHLQGRTRFQKRVEAVRMDDSIRRVFGEVPPLTLATERIHHNCFQAALCQRRLEVGADKAGAAGDQDHGGGL